MRALIWVGAALLIAGCMQPKSPVQYADEIEKQLATRVSKLDTTKSPPELPLPKNPPKTVNIEKVRTESAKITTLVIEEIVIGSGPVIRAGEAASVHYVGTLSDGFVFDTSYKGDAKPYSFAFGPDAQVIEGWRIGLIGMKVGGRRKLIVPASMAYGANPPPGPIPPNAALIFDVQLMFVGGPAF